MAKPQLEAILKNCIAQRESEGGIGALLFPSHRFDQEKMLDNIDKQLDKIGERASITKPRLHAFRHSYTAARLQTLEHGAPVSLWQVASELGHQSTAMIEKRYGHLAKVTDRKEVVEFLPNLDKQPYPRPSLPLSRAGRLDFLSLADGVGQGWQAHATLNGS